MDGILDSIKMQVKSHFLPLLYSTGKFILRLLLLLLKDNPEDDPCYVGEGKGRLYLVEQNTGNAVYNFDQSNDVTITDPELGMQRLYDKRRSDRVDDGGGKITGILSEPIVTFIQGTTVGYAGVSAGIKKVKMIFPKSLVPIYWFLKGGQ